MTWNKIDLESSFKKEDKVKFNLQDEEGNDLLKDEDEVTLNKEEDNNDSEDNIEVEDSVEVSKGKEPKSNKQDASKDDVGDKDLDGDEEEKRQKKSRAQERIRELVRKNKENEAKWTQELETLKKQLQYSTKESLSSQKDFIDARITDVKKSLVKAQEEGRFDEAADLMSSLSDLQTKKLVVDSSVDKTKQQEELANKKQTSSDTSTEDFDDTELLSWVVKNSDWWQKDPVKTTLAVRLSKKIDKEGLLTPDDPDYYVELDERLSKLLGTKNRNNNNEEDEDDADNEEASKDLQSSSKEGVKTKKPPQTSSSSGTSRNPNNNGKTNKSKLVISLSADERAMARKLGMTDLDWAKQKFRQQKHTDENGYQVIFDN